MDLRSLLLVLLLYDRVKGSSAIECLEAERVDRCWGQVESVLDGSTLKTAW